MPTSAFGLITDLQSRAESENQSALAVIADWSAVKFAYNFEHRKSGMRLSQQAGKFYSRPVRSATCLQKSRCLRLEFLHDSKSRGDRERRHSISSCEVAVAAALHYYQKRFRSHLVFYAS